MENSINFQNLNIVIPESIYKLDIEKQRNIYEYLNQMNEFEKKAYLIAMNHLGTSFNILKSNGYKEWKQ